MVRSSLSKVSKLIPWVYPSRDLSHLPGTCPWRSSSPLAYFEKWVGRDPVVDILSIGMDHQFYQLGLPRPNAHTSYDLVRHLFSGSTWLIFDEACSHGEFMDDLEWESEDLLGEHMDADQVLERGNFFCLPSGAYHKLTAERREGRASSRDMLDFGYHSLLEVTGIPCLRIDGWTTLPKEPITDLSMAETSFIVKPKDRWQDDRFLVMKDRRVPHKFQSPTFHPGIQPDGNEVNSTWFESKFRNGILMARPEHRSNILMDLKSPLDALETLYLAPTQASGQITLEVLAKFLEQIFSGERVRSARHCAEVLARYLNSKENQLAAAIGLPRVCIQKPQKMFDPQGYDRVELLNEVEQALPEIKNIRGFAGIETWVRRLLCRALLQIHMRGGHIADMSYRTTMYPLVDLIYSMIKAPKGASAPYLQPMLLLGSLTQKPRVVEEKQESVRDPIQEIPDDIFQ